MTSLVRTCRWIGAAALVAALAAVPAAGADAPVPAPAAAKAAAPGEPAAPPQEPVQISADQAEYFNDKGIAVFTGKVVAVQGDATLGAERMEIAFSEPAQPAKGSGGLAGASAGRKITSITATTAVSYRQVDAQTKKERYATGEKAVYDEVRRTVTMSGNPRLWEDKNVIVGEEMTFFIDEKKVVVKGKVNLTVYPKDLKEADPPR